MQRINAAAVTTLGQVATIVTAEGTHGLGAEELEETDNDPNTVPFAATGPKISNPAGSEFVQGQLIVSAANKDGFELATRKYGATVVPVKQGSGYTWKVTAVNPADQVDKVGDTYAAKTLKSTSGVTIYSFPSSRRGIYYKRLGI